jgi:hypothetical protein
MNAGVTVAQRSPAPVAMALEWKTRPRLDSGATRTDETIFPLSGSNRSTTPSRASFHQSEFPP